MTEIIVERAVNQVKMHLLLKIAIFKLVNFLGHKLLFIFRLSLIQPWLPHYSHTILRNVVHH